MDLQAIDPRATAAAAGGRDTQSSSGGAFKGVMQMMAEISANRTESRPVDRSDSARASRVDDRDDFDDKDESDDVRASDAPKSSDEKDTHERDADVGAEPVVTVDPLPQTTPAPIATTDDQASAQAQTPVTSQAATAAPDASATQIADRLPAQTQSAATAGASQPVDPTAAGRGPERPDTAAPSPAKDLAPQNAAQAATQATTQAATTTPRPQEAMPQPREPQLTAAQQAAAQQAQAATGEGERIAKTAGNGQKPETGGRGDALMNAKVTVEPATPVARSQGVSSAVLVQAQQAAAGAQPQVSTANGGAASLHVGGNQPTFVGADAANSGGGQNANGQNAGGQNASGQNPGGQNAGNQGQGTPQQVGVSFGATIGQRGFGGDASRAQFQQILATRTARPQAAALSSGDAVRPMGASTASSSTTPMTMAGVGGPQSTHTSASPVNRAAATAHGRPGAAPGTPADQVAVKLSATAKDGGGRVTVRLNPEELGKVDVKMEIANDGKVRAVIAVERPETLELLQRDAKGLEKALQDAGLQTDGDSLEFDLRGDGGQSAEDTGDGSGDAAGKDGPSHGGDDGDAVAETEQDEGSGGVKADGSLDLVA